MTEKKTKKKKVETTGHNWDGISEYNIPAPRWWLIVWMVCIIWAMIYWVFYPTWPTPGGNTKGLLNWSSQEQLSESQSEIDLIRSEELKKISKLSLNQIKKDKNLMEFALNGGRSAFKENCAACHGTGAQGFKGFPNLNDDDWLWGGKLTDIYQTLNYGIRSGHEKARSNQMPAFGMDQILQKDEISDVTEYVNCAACHGLNGKGNKSLGAPNLSDQIWLYGGEKSDIIFTINYSRNGVMPFWKDRLDDTTIKQLSLYVHSLGGGE
jgi:cytochrome c oxidase cbb3-type subunit 3